MPFPSALAVHRNDAVRALLHRGVLLAGLVSAAEARRRIRSFAEEQDRLREWLGVRPDTPIRPWSASVQEEVDRTARGRRRVEYAFTSGSTATPKRLAFTPRRIRAIKRGSFGVASRLLAENPSWRAVMFILAGTRPDGSLTSLLLSPRSRWPSAVEGLVTPSAYLHAPDVVPAMERFGDAAVRLWLLALCNPGLLYSTNPSTLAVFFQRLEEDWEQSVALVRAHLRAPEALPEPLRAVASRTAARGFQERLELLAAARTFPPPWEFLPGLRAYCSWDGGYVRPYLTQLQRHLPAERYRFVPMYSMSTELVETLTVFENGAPHFLPLAPGTLYEFLPEDAPDEPARLLRATALEAGRRYTMVASHGDGLVRYQTEDVFLCAGHVAGVPDLRFVQRRGLTWSFTGEKLTDSHVQAAFEALRARFPALRDVHLCLLPSQPKDPGALPAYRLLLAPAGERPAPPPVPLGQVVGTFEEALSAQNPEYPTKRSSGRLGPVQASVVPYPTLARALHGAGKATLESGWESQFKLLPLHRKLWEELPLPPGAAHP